MMIRGIRREFRQRCARQWLVGSVAVVLGLVAAGCGSDAKSAQTTALASTTAPAEVSAPGTEAATEASTTAPAEVSAPGTEATSEASTTAPAEVSAPGTEATSEASTTTPAPLSQATVTFAAGLATTASMPPWIATDQGFFAKYGLDVSIAPVASSTADMMAGIEAGSFDVATLGPGAILDTIAQDATLTMLSATGYGTDQVLALNRKWAEAAGVPIDGSPEEQLAALKGTNLHVSISSVNSGAALDFQFAAPDYDLVVGEDVTLEATGEAGSAMAAARSGQVDGSMGNNSRVLAGLPGDEFLFIPLSGFPSLRGAPALIVFAKTEFVEKHPDTIAALEKGLLEAYDYVVKTPFDAGKDVLSRFYAQVELDPALMPVVYGSAQHLFAAEPGTPAITQEGYERALAQTNARRSSTSPPLEPIDAKYADIVSSEFVDAAIDELGLNYPKSDA